MANAAAMAEAQEPLRVQIGGWPKGGKTGAIVSLLKAGYKVRLLAFEANYDVLLRFTPPELLKNLDIAVFEDRMTSDGATPFGVDMAPKDMAFSRAMQQMKDWKTTDEKGEPISLGPSFQWGPDTVVVVDSTTAMGEASINRAIKIRQKRPGEMDVQVWTLASSEMMNFLMWMARKTNKFHLVVLSHWIMLGPEIPMSAKSEDDDVKSLKTQLAVERAALLPTKLFPKGVTKEQSRAFNGKFPVLLEAKRIVNGSKVSRWLYTETDEELDLAFPVPGADKRYPIETGLATIFELLGAKAPAKEKANGKA